MLANIITNAIETPRGYKNPDTGIALRGPLSQFFSALYLKPLDDAFDNHQHVDYFRYQDDILILCQTERSLARCKRKMLDILGGRRLSLSRKKTLIGRIDKGFHFLGIHYLGTQPSNNTNVQHLDKKNTLDNINGHCLSSLGGETSRQYLTHRMSKCASFHIQGLCAKHVRMLSRWSQVESLSKGSKIIFQTGLLGG